MRPNGWLKKGSAEQLENSSVGKKLNLHRTKKNRTFVNPFSGSVELDGRADMLVQTWTCNLNRAMKPLLMFQEFF